MENRYCNSSAEHLSSRGHSLLLPLSRACYNRRVRIAAERDALWERRPQQVIFRRTHYEWPKAKRAIRFCARRPLCGRQKRGEKYGGERRRRFYLFLFSGETRRKNGAAEGPRGWR